MKLVFQEQYRRIREFYEMEDIFWRRQLAWNSDLII